MSEFTQSNKTSKQILATDINIQGAQNSWYSWNSWDCHEILSIRRYLRDLGISWDFFPEACPVFKLIILIFYLLDNEKISGESLTDVTCM